MGIVKPSCRWQVLRDVASIKKELNDLRHIGYEWSSPFILGQKRKGQHLKDGKSD